MEHHLIRRRRLSVVSDTAPPQVASDPESLLQALGVRFPAQHSWPVEVRCGPVVLRPVHRRDRSSWHEVRQRNAVWNGPWDATMPSGGRATSTDFVGMVKNFDRQARELRTLAFVICWDEHWPRESTPGRRLPLAGQLTISGITWGSANFAHAGYWVDQALAGRGVMPTALALGTDYCFITLGLHRMEVNIRPENAKSLRVVEKLGLRDEGIRERYLHIDGQWRDHRSFAVCTEDVPDGLLGPFLASDTPRWLSGHLRTGA
ncbi:GNAT family N-acetyltransferase [Luteococcus sp.]|uniref:GNAT family N-acetyltransferase n=1 Tax=Luteococcus sp. TaxID=1969402 RepID=UPI003735995C